MARYVTFEHDPDPDLSWLSEDNGPIYRNRADMKAGRNPIPAERYTDPELHTTLQMIVYEQHGTNAPVVVDSLGGIDFFTDMADDADWVTGTFYSVTAIPRECRYLRQLAREAGLRYARRSPRRPRTQPATDGPQYFIGQPGSHDRQDR